MREVLEEIREFRRYHILERYRYESDYMLHEEWDELEDLIKRNDRIRDIEIARGRLFRGEISEEQFQKLCDSYEDELKARSMEQDADVKKEKKKGGLIKSLRKDARKNSK